MANSNTPQKIVIVGGAAGGATAAARLRRLSESAEIVMLERGRDISSAGCGLPYYVGGEITEKSALTLQTPETFRKRFHVDVRVGHEVTAIDRSAKTVSVKNLQTGETGTEHYDKLILSTGAEPVRPKLDGFGSNRIFTLRNIPDTCRIREFLESHKPECAVVAGGGYIGLEMAENLHRAGLDVTIVQRGEHVLEPLDFDMACDVHRHIESKGVRLLLKNEVLSVSEQNGKLRVTLQDMEIAAEMMILATGVRPESSLAQDAGLEVNSRGAIVVSDAMRTSDAEIYAVGDAVEISDFLTGQKGYMPLAGPANKQGRIAADQICGIDSRYTGTQGSAVLRVFDMTVAVTGLNEAAAQKAGLNYEKVFLWPTSHAGYYPGAVNMSLKVLFEKPTGRLLGAQITGYDGVDKRCDVIAAAIRAKRTAYDLTRLELCYAPPYSSAKDPVNMAGFVMENVLTGKAGLFHWHDVAARQKEPDVTLLDVRTPMEYANGHMDGFVNIPLDELRERLGELDASKKVYVTCQVGLRGYNAARILMQNGFDTYNLSGGYRLWHSIFGPKVKPPSQNTAMPAAPAGKPSDAGQTIGIDACGLQCPGPIMKLSAAMNAAKEGDIIEIKTTDPAFASDVEGYCRRVGGVLLESVSEKGFCLSKVQKGKTPQTVKTASNGKNFIVFSGDLDKAVAAFIMANASAALGRKVSIFFTFWGLSILRKPGKVAVRKSFLERMFGWMMPRGSRKLPLSKMNMAGFGPQLIRMVMKRKNVDSLEMLIQTAQRQGVELVACAMSMDVMGIKPEELLDGVKIGGAAAMLAHAEESDMSLFI
ncbi:MAG: FAD-dependent oxidoreductase [Planctomycetaceae bacterium]|nr:FAD-dependent oxidoreductase [Planctomycetaceae bacterium]